MTHTKIFGFIQRGSKLIPHHTPFAWVFAAGMVGIASMIEILPPDAAAATTGNLIGNPGFEQPGNGIPPLWISEQQVRHKGRVLVRRLPDGNRVVTLQPNAQNIPEEQDSHPLSVGQVFNLAKNPGLRGATLYLSARMGASKPATARMRLIAIRKGGALIARVLEQGNSEGKLAEHSGTMKLPDDDKTLVVILGLDAVGTSGDVSFDDVYLGTRPREAPKAAAKAIPGGHSGMADIQLDASHVLRQIPNTLYGVNIEWIWDGNGIWDGKKDALNPDIVQLARELHPTLMRFPGGIFADFYHWRDGIGPRDKRPVTAHMPGGPKSKHNFGTDEALKFARSAGSELMITVNISTGTPEEAVAWLRYVNHPDKTQAEPARVKYWEIGNENYYYGETPYLKQSGLDSKQYAKRFLKFAQAMKKADPRIKLLAVAQESYEKNFKPIHPDWIPELLSRDGHLIDYLALHNGYVPGLEHDSGQNLRTVYAAMLAAPIQLRRSLDRVQAQIRRYAPKQASRIKLAITEWAPSFQIALNGRFLDHPKTLGSALFVASNLKNYIEDPDVEIADYFKLSGRLWQGMIGMRNGKFIPKATYYAFRMYRDHFGSLLVASKTQSPTFNSSAVGYVPALQNVPYLDVVSSLSSNGKKLYIMVINKNFDHAIKARIRIAGFAPKSRGSTFTLTGMGIDANTGTELFKAPGVKWAPQAVDKLDQRFNKGAPGEITLKKTPINHVKPDLEYTFAKHSVTAIVLDKI